LPNALIALHGKLNIPNSSSALILEREPFKARIKSNDNNAAVVIAIKTIQLAKLFRQVQSPSKTCWIFSITGFDLSLAGKADRPAVASFGNSAQPLTAHFPGPKPSGMALAMNLSVLHFL
jgi:hypothetical protein